MANRPDDSIHTPIVSRLLSDGTMVETLLDAHQGTTTLAICEPGWAVTLAEHFDLPTKERLVPYSARNNLIATGCVLLPSAVGEPVEKERLVEEVKTHLHRYVDLSDLYEEIAAYYVLLTWVYDAFSELPYFRFQGDFGTGKTRALLTIGSICYKPFFASGASTVSPIFHILDGIGGTLVLDEADLRFSDATADLTKILNNGSMDGLPVLRTMTNRHRELNPKAFRVFGPKIIAMRQSFDDEALESRFLTEQTGGRAVRRDIDVHLPARMKAEAELLRNRLLAWRFSARNSVHVNQDRAISGVSSRGNQTALALLSLIDEPGLRRRIGDELLVREADQAIRRAMSPEHELTSILYSLFQEATRASVGVAQVATAYNERLLDRGERALTVKAVGWLIRSRLGIATMKSRGVYVVPQAEWPGIERLANRYGFAGAPATSASDAA